MGKVHHPSRRSFLRLLGMGALASATLPFSGCSELFGPRESSPHMVGFSLFRHLAIENIGPMAIRDLRVSFSVDFHVGGQARNAFNWVDGYPILQASTHEQWTWAIATPTDFDLLDTRSPFSLDPDEFSFNDTQNEVGDFSATFVFRRPELKQGDPWQITLLYLAAENDIGLIQLYRQIRPENESFPMPTPLMPNAHEDYITLADKEKRFLVRADATRLLSPIVSIERSGQANATALNPIYQEGLGAKYRTSQGELVVATSDSVRSPAIEIFPQSTPGVPEPAQQLCGEQSYRQLKWKWCILTPRIWFHV